MMKFNSKNSLLVLILLSFSSHVRGFAPCSNYYNSRGDLIKKADINNCEKIRFFIKNKESFYKEFKLNDPNVEDQKYLSSPPSVIFIVTLDMIKDATRHVPKNTILDVVSLYLAATESWGALDFHHSFPKDVLIDDTFYGSKFDSGNFLWGYSMAKIGVPLDTSLIGAHYNAIVIDDHHTWDSAADIRAIIKGYLFFLKNMDSSDYLKMLADLQVF